MVADVVAVAVSVVAVLVVGGGGVVVVAVVSVADVVFVVIYSGTGPRCQVLNEPSEWSMRVI